MELFDFLTWDEIVFGEFIECCEISPNIMKQLDDSIESIMEELKK